MMYQKQISIYGKTRPFRISMLAIASLAGLAYVGTPNKVNLPPELISSPIEITKLTENLLSTKRFSLQVPIHQLYHKHLFDALLASSKNYTDLVFDLKDEGNDDRIKYFDFAEKIATANAMGYKVGARVVLFRDQAGYVDPYDTNYFQDILQTINKAANWKPQAIALDYIRFAENLRLCTDDSRIDHITTNIFRPILETLYNADFTGELQIFVFGDAAMLYDKTMRNIGQDPVRLTEEYEKFCLEKGTRKFGLCFRPMTYGGTHSSQGNLAFSQSSAQKASLYTGSAQNVFSSNAPIRYFPGQANVLYTFKLSEYLATRDIRFETCILGNDYLDTLSEQGTIYLLEQAAVSMRQGDGYYFFNVSANKNTVQQVQAAVTLSKKFFEDHPQYLDLKNPLPRPLIDLLQTWVNENTNKFPEYANLWTQPVVL